MRRHTDSHTASVAADVSHTPGRASRHGTGLAAASPPTPRPMNAEIDAHVDGADSDEGDVGDAAADAQ